MKPDHQKSAALKEQRTGPQNDDSMGQIFTKKDSFLVSLVRETPSSSKSPAVTPSYK